MALVAAGLLNKQIGSELGISEITVKAHRGRMMQKMKADSLPDLVRMDAKLQIARVPTSNVPRTPAMVREEKLARPDREARIAGLTFNSRQSSEFLQPWQP